MEVPVSEIRAGDRVLIRPGARIPVDGVVVSGSSSVEEAAITGEPWHKISSLAAAFSRAP